MKLKYLIFTTFLIVVIWFFVNFRQEATSSFLISQNDNGIALSENAIPILFYQKKMKSLDGKYGRNNYIHPLYDLKGEILTEDFPEDHPYHRGVFWAWHQIYVEDSLVSDSWSLDNFTSTITESTVENKGNKVIINLTSEWSSSSYVNNKPYLQEKTQIDIYKKTVDYRIIDIRITLNALVDNFKLGGANNEKGYGGLCLRIKMPDDLTFSSKNGKVKPKTFQIDAGPWMDFSANFRRENNVSGVTLFCHPSNFGYPQNWILRRKSSMQNIVFPGQKPIKINPFEPVVLNYRMIIHEGLTYEDLTLQERVYSQKLYE